MKTKWNLLWNPRDCYWEVHAPLGLIVRRFPHKWQAEEYLDVVLQDEGWEIE